MNKENGAFINPVRVLTSVSVVWWDGRRLEGGWTGAGSLSAYSGAHEYASVPVCVCVCTCVCVCVIVCV